MENKFHVENWDTMSDEDREKTNKLLEQHEQFLRKQFSQEEADKVEQAKEEAKKQAEEELTAKQKAQQERENALSNVPEANKNFVNKLLDKGFTIDEIKQDKPDLFTDVEAENAETMEKQALNQSLTNQIAGKHDAGHTTYSGEPDAVRDAKIKDWKAHGMPENATDQDWEDWNTWHKQGLC